MSESEKAFEEWHPYDCALKSSKWISWAACWKNHVEPLRKQIDHLSTSTCSMTANDTLNELQKENKKLADFAIDIQTIISTYPMATEGGAAALRKCLKDMEKK